MPEPISGDMIRAIFAEDGEAIAALATVDGVGLDAPLRVTTWAGELPNGGRGLISNEVTYEYFPFKFAGGGSGPTESVRDARLEIANIDGRVIRAVKEIEANTRPTIDIQTVRVAAPDVVETAMLGAKIRTARVSGATATATIAPRDFADEPACKARYTPSRFPALF